MSVSLDGLLRANEQEALRAFLERVIGGYGTHIQDVMLFGSTARDDSERNSDIDSLLIADVDTWQFKHSISALASDIGIGLECDVLIDARVVGVERWRRMATEQFSLYRNVADEGIPLTSAAGSQTPDDT
ncbi:MAG: nucleotidyltransferase domain-containing protein [Anaerolineae bacterium]